MQSKVSNLSVLMYFDLLIAIDLQMALIFSKSVEKGKLNSILTLSLDSSFEVGLCSKTIYLSDSRGKFMITSAFFYVNEAKGPI